MSKNSATKTTDRTKELNLSALDFYFEFEPEFVFAYSPDALRAVCETSNQVARLFVLRMSEMRVAAPDNPAVERPGFIRALSEQEWLQKMITLARGLEGFNYDVDEACYAEFNTARQAKIAASEARRASRRTPIPAKQGCIPEPDKATGPRDKIQVNTEERAESEYFLRGFRKGQLQISNIITRSRILCVGARQKGRQLWSEDAPLVVREVSGFKAGEVVISYAGQELRPKDILIWSKVLAMAAASPLGTKVNISRAQLLRARGGGDSSNSAKAAEEEIDRLQHATFKVTIRCSRTIAAIADGCPEDKSIQDAKKTGTLTLSFHLLGQTSTSGRLWTIHVEPVVRLLFGKGVSSWFDERIYRSINGDFAKRLYLLYYSHRECYPLTLFELRQYLGSTMAEDSDFQDAVDGAHDELAKKGVICEDWKFEESSRRFKAVAYVVTRPDREEREDVNVDGA